MAYTKTTWNNLSNPPINADNLNKIEQGIYDNSLGIDKINPSGTATTTAEIEEGQINDVIGFKSMKLKGQTSQYTTTGSQLFDISNTSIDTQYIYNNGFKLTKSTNRTREITLRTPIPAGNYYISADVINSTLSNNNQMYVTFKGANNTNVLENVRFLNNGAVTINAEVISLYFFVANSEADTATITLDNIMLNSGSTRKDFEKYTGSKASPNPDFPQDVNNVSGDNVVGISNKNLIENETFVQGAFNDSTSTKRISCRNIKLKANTTYTLSSNLNYSTYNMAIVTSKKSFPISSGEQIYDSGWKTANFSFTTGNDDVYCNIAIKKVGELTIVPSDVSTYHFQIEQNNSATSYIAHQGNNFEINLGKNILDYATNVIENALINTTGLIATTSECTTVWCKVKPNTTYTLSREKGDRIVIGGSNTQPALNLTTTLLKNEGVTEVKNYTFNSGNYKYVAIYISRYTTTKPTWVQVEKGTIATSYADYFPPIEICKIGTYQDYIFKKDGKWWKHKEIGKIVIDETYNWTRETSSSWVCPRFYCATLPDLGTTVNGTVFNNSISNMAKVGNTSDYTQNENVFLLRRVSNTNRIDCIFDLESVDDLKSILANENMLVYYGLITPTEEEITYTPLIRQLDELYNSGLYDVTNISQDNSSEAFILDLEACKNNINGIVEYIRR